MLNYKLTSVFILLPIKKAPITGAYKNWGRRIRTSEMAGPKPAALPLGDVPSLTYYII